jgi:hypothetical protein
VNEFATEEVANEKQARWSLATHEALAFATASFLTRF